MEPSDVCPLPGSEVGILGHRYIGHPGPWGVNEHEMKALMPRLRMDNELTMALPGENEYGTMDPYGLDLLLRVARDLEPRYILEIGTFHGLTTRRLAEAAPKAKILTIDLPQNGSPALATDYAFVDPQRVGEHWLSTEFEDRITQILVDSGTVAARDQAFAWLESNVDQTASTFSEPPFFDLVLIDGAHDLDSTLNTFVNLVVPTMADTAVVFFDDYARMASHTGVTHCVLQLAYGRQKDFYWYTPTGQTSHVALYLHNNAQQ